jgi:hypothetical protein
MQRLVQGDAERELIGARGDRLARELLGRHVHRRAEDGAGPGQRLRQRVRAGQAAGARRQRRHRSIAPGRAVVGPAVIQAEVAAGGDLAGDADDAEIGHPDPAGRGQEDVVGLEVAVDQPGVVRRGQAAPGLHEHRQGLGQAVPARHPPAQGAVVRELHRQVHLVAEGADLVHGDDVGVVDLGHRLRLAQQAGARVAGLAGQGPGAQQLDRDLAIEVRVVGGVHQAHAAATEQAEHDEATDAVAACRRADRGIAAADLAGADLTGARAIEQGRGHARAGPHVVGADADGGGGDGEGRRPGAWGGDGTRRRAASHPPGDRPDVRRTS